MIIYLRFCSALHGFRPIDLRYYRILTWVYILATVGYDQMQVAPFAADVLPRVSGPMSFAALAARHTTATLQSIADVT